MQPRVISFHYTLRDKDGETLDTSRESEPMAFLEGVHQIVPGLEEELVGMKVGEQRKVVVPVEKGYGPYREQLVQKVARAQLNMDNIKLGERVEAHDGQRTFILTVTALDDQEATLDANHPLAGQELYFDVEITAVRNATPEEVSHGHAHGEGGHHH